MSTSVGEGISIPIGGDTSGLSAAVKEAVDKLTELQRKHAQLDGAVKEASAAFGAESAIVKTLQQDFDRVDASMNKLTGTTTKLHKSFEFSSAGLKDTAKSGNALRETADQLDNKLGKIQVIIGGIASAAGASGGAIQNMVGGFADLAMGVASGVGIIAAASAAFAVMNKYMEDAEKAAKALDQAWDEAGSSSLKLAQSLDEQLKATRRLIEAQKIARATGADASGIERQLKGLDDITAAQERLARSQAALAQYRRVTVAEVEGVATRAGYVSPRVVAEQREVEAQRAEGQLNYEKQVAADQRALDATVKAAEAAEDLATETKETARVLDALKQNLMGTADALALAERTVGFSDDARGGKNLLDGAPDVFVDRGFANVADATERELSDLGRTVGFVDETIFDLRDSIEKVERAFDDMSSTLLNGAVSLAGTLTGGGGAGAGRLAGTAVGGAAGGVLGPLVGIDPATGGALGGILGGGVGDVLGGLLDKLVESLGVFTPLFDALGTVVAAMQPIFMVTGEAARGWGVAIEALAPLVLALTRPLAGVILVVVRLLEVFLLAVPVLATLLMGFARVLEIAMPLFKALDGALVSFLNAIVMLANAFIGLQNEITKAGRKVFGESFGIMLEPLTAFSTVIEEFAQDQADLGNAVNDNTDAINRQVDESLVNLPPGVKVAGYAYGAANVGGVSVGVMNVYPRGSTAQELDDMRRRGLRGTAQSLGRNTITEDKN